MADSDTSGLSCLLVILFGVVPSLFFGDFLVKHYEVTDGITQMLIYVGSAVLLSSPFAAISAIIIAFVFGFFIIPLTWMLDWFRKPKWKEMAENWEKTE